MTRKLHIGGTTAYDGWEILNVIPALNVDHVLNAQDLSSFADNTFSEMYASHVVEHLDYIDVLFDTLKDWLRVLEPGGRIFISVPDMDILSWLFLSKILNMQERYQVMRMMFGGHVDAHDYHVAGLNQEFLTDFLTGAGFVGIKRVNDFGLFKDTSTLLFKGIPISLNLIAEKPPGDQASPA